MTPISTYNVSVGIDRFPDVVNVYNELQSNEGLRKQRQGKVKIVKVLKSRHSQYNRGKLHLLTSYNTIIVALGAESRVDEFEKVIEEKGFAEVRFWYSYRSKYEGRFYNFGQVDEILNKTPVTPDPGTNKAQEGFDLFWEAVEAE